MVDSLETVLRRALNNFILVYKFRIALREQEVEVNPPVERLPIQFSKIGFSKNAVNVDEGRTYRFTRHLAVEKTRLWELLTLEAGDGRAVGWKIVMPFELSSLATDPDVIAQQFFDHTVEDWEKLYLDYNERHLVIPLGAIDAKKLDIERGAYGDEVLVKLDEGEVEYGYEDEETFEYFLHGERYDGRVWMKRMRQRLELREPAQRRIPKRANQWIFGLPKVQIPMILRDSIFVQGVSVPRQERIRRLAERAKDKGRSFLPKAIRDRVPEGMRYWQTGKAADLEQARKKAGEMVKTPERGKGDRKVEL